MKKLITICLLIVSLALTGIVQADVSWNYLSPLNVQENITDLGGTYRYSYSFVNVDSSPIWFLGIYTNFATNGDVGDTTFTGHESWRNYYYLNANMFPEYVGTNLDPSILGTTFTQTWPLWPDAATSILIGEAASGFSFTANVYDPSQKYYFYETIASGWTQTNVTGKVAAVGLTGVVIPAPGAILLGSIGVGLVGWLRRRRTL